MGKKYSNELKLEVVKYYNKYKCGYAETAKHFYIPSLSTVRKWVRKYNEHGAKGLIRNASKNYSGEFKQSVIEYMHANHLSRQEVTYHFNIGCVSVITQWEQIYNEKGPQALYKAHCGRKRKMSSKPRKKKLSEEKHEDLIAELEQLRMENAYLKKLQALIQERTKPKPKKK